MAAAAEEALRTRPAQTPDSEFGTLFLVPRAPSIRIMPTLGFSVRTPN